MGLTRSEDMVAWWSVNVMSYCNFNFKFPLRVPGGFIRGGLYFLKVSQRGVSIRGGGYIRGNTVFSSAFLPWGLLYIHIFDVFLFFIQLIFRKAIITSRK